MGHAMERLLERCEDSATKGRFEKLIILLTQDKELRLELFPTTRDFLVASPFGGLKISNLGPITFLPADHVVHDESVITYLDVIEARVERIINRRYQEQLALMTHRPDGRIDAGKRRARTSRAQREAEDSIRFTQLRSLWDLGAVQVSFADIVTFAEKRGWREAGEALDNVADWLETWVSQGRLIEIGGEGQEVWAFKLGKEK